MSLATVGKQYMAAIAPADKALSSFRDQALAYTGGPPTRLVAAIPPTRGTLKAATKQLLAIQAPAPLSGDIKDLVATVNAVDADLVAIGDGKAPDIEGHIAKLVADMGRQAAADSTFRFTLQLLIDPGSLPTPSTVVPVTTVPPTTVKGKKTTTTVPRTSTTSVVRTATTVRPTTTTSHP